MGAFQGANLVTQCWAHLIYIAINSLFCVGNHSMMHLRPEWCRALADFYCLKPHPFPFIALILCTGVLRTFSDTRPRQTLALAGPIGTLRRRIKKVLVAASKALILILQQLTDFRPQQTQTKLNLTFPS